MSSKAGKNKDSKDFQTQARTRLLLTLWDLGGSEAGVKKGDLTKRIVRTGETSQDYKNILTELEESKAIEIANKNRITQISLTNEGRHSLAEGLKSAEFEFDGTQVGSRVANALLKWIRQMDGAVSVPASKGKPAAEIASYEKFKPEVLALFEKLDKGHNYSGLVPIWHLRRELGEQVGREDFNEWLMKMQGEQLFYLQSGEARGATDDQKRDSITDDVRGLLFFASQQS